MQQVFLNGEGQQSANSSISWKMGMTLSHLILAHQEHLERRAVGHIVFGLNHDVIHDLKHVRGNVQLLLLEGVAVRALVG